MSDYKGPGPRPTKYRGIQMRSRLEASIAQWMDGEGIEWTYEPECFASEAGQYLPDFELHNLHEWESESDGDVYLLQTVPLPHRVFVEVKPTMAMAEASLQASADVMRANTEHILLSCGWKDPTAPVSWLRVMAGELVSAGYVPDVAAKKPAIVSFRTEARLLLAPVFSRAENPWPWGDEP